MKNLETSCLSFDVVERDFWENLPFVDREDPRFDGREELKVTDNIGRYRIITSGHGDSYCVAILDDSIDNGCCGAYLDNKDALFDARHVNSLEEARRLHLSVLEYFRQLGN